MPKINETCIPESCDVDTDCIAGYACVYGACATASDAVAAGCPCLKSSQCSNNDCITADVLALDFVCNPEKNETVGGNETGTKDGASVISICAVVAVASVMTIFFSL